ncbi:hypothetical protein BS78_05G227300 [Paspalum vaginatum]|nr:hypothetical protein BS78_05G227300 [Paspalum vaginatum]
MATAFPCAVPCKILVVAVAMIALFSPTGEAVKYGLCRGQCMDVEPNCSAWCHQIGYRKGGECIAPHYYECCCWEVPPAENATAAAAAGPSSHALHA